MYQQTLGRFLSRDPLAENGIDVMTDTGFYGERLAAMRANPWYYGGNGENLYVYCGNNPVNYIDPSGLDYQRCELRKTDYFLKCILANTASQWPTCIYRCKCPKQKSNDQRNWIEEVVEITGCPCPEPRGGQEAVSLCRDYLFQATCKGDCAKAGGTRPNTSPGCRAK